MTTADKLAEIAKANQQSKRKENNPQKRASWASHEYVRFVNRKCKELAQKGYGSVQITIDFTWDMFGIVEKCGYSGYFVCSLLEKEGYILGGEEERVDHHDAITMLLTWAVDLPKAPDSMKIGMTWD